MNCVYKKLKQYACILLLFAVTASLVSCDDANNNNESVALEISDLQMVLLCDIVYRDELDTYLANGQELPIDDEHSPIRDDYLDHMYERMLPSELSGFTVVDFKHGDISGFRAGAFKKDNNIVVVYCGTEDFADVMSDIGVATFDVSSQDDKAKQFARDNANKYADCNIYITGYSMGGRLAYLGAETIVDAGQGDRLRRVCTFNSLGVKEILDSSDSHLSHIHHLETKIKDITVNHIVKGDDVSDGWIKNNHRLLHIGDLLYYDCTNPLNNEPIKVLVFEVNMIRHDLYTLIDALSEHLKGSRDASDRIIKKREPLQDFNIIGSWKSIGDNGFGQAQPGSIVTFDGEHCDFYSPNDTYSLYQYDGKIQLECTSMIFSETLKFDVIIIDDSNIQIQYGSTTTKLKRLDTSSGKMSGVANSDFSIVGCWKSVGDYGFGQAQPGATVTFNGTHCNFYSPYDTYNFYQEAGKWKLSCKNVLWKDVLTFTVEVIDNDNINIYYSPSSVTKLKRTN